MSGYNNQNQRRQSAAQPPLDGGVQNQEQVAPSTSQVRNKKQGQRRRVPGQSRPQTSQPMDFRPKALVTEPSPMMNDPLTESCFFPIPGESMAEVSGEKAIYPGAEGLTDLIETEYIKLAAHAFNLKRNISQSGYAYYAAVLTWCRMLEVNANNGGTLSTGEQSMINQVKQLRPPKILGSYLAGMGDTQYSNGFHKLRMRIRSPVLHNDPEGLPGYFGPIQTNARFYASYPCIAVYAKRMMADIYRTSHRDDEVWDLPADFLFQDHALTQSCLGYANATELDRAQLNTYSLCGLTASSFPYTNREYAFSLPLMNEIQAWIDEVHHIKTVPFPIAPTGSRGQLVTVSVYDATNGRQTLSTFQAYSCERLAAGAEFAGGAFKYRLKKAVTGAGSSDIKKLLCPFSVTNANQVPNDLGFLRDAETDGMLAVSNGTCNPYIPMQRLRSFVEADIEVQR